MNDHKNIITHRIHTENRFSILNHLKQNYHQFHFFLVLIIATAISFGFLYLSLVSSIPSQAQTGSTYYVATTGNDSNSCSHGIVHLPRSE